MTTGQWWGDAPHVRCGRDGELGKMARQQGKRTGHHGHRNDHAGPAAYRTGEDGHEEKGRGTADQRERVVHGLEVNTRGVGVVEGVAVGMGWTK
jgi:hypothetical protein